MKRCAHCGGPVDRELHQAGLICSCGLTCAPAPTAFEAAQLAEREADRALFVHLVTGTAESHVAYSEAYDRWMELLEQLPEGAHPFEPALIPPVSPRESPAPAVVSVSWGQAGVGGQGPPARAGALNGAGSFPARRPRPPLVQLDSRRRKDGA